MNNNFTNSYQIPECRNTAREANIQYCPDFSKNYEKFKTQIKNLVQNNESKTFYKFSDGEYLFAKGIAIGSTSKGKRDTNIGCNELDLTPFSEGIFRNDYYMAEHYEQSLNEFNNFFEGKNITPLPAEYAYGLVSNKWFFKTFKGQIGLIGAKEKLELIQELLEYKEYRDYLGIDKFEDYIHIPQQFACDDIEATNELVTNQLKNAKSKIFLEGIGHAKQALLWKMKKTHPAVYISVGCGICAIAGVQDCIGRPYFADWKNYRIKEYDYSKIDIWKETDLENVIWL
tara:strand:- start:534 stop:1391 length:858 start_codon:yes stop_codon:yes gene_type:complete